MEAKIQKQIIDYFSFFEELYSASNSSLKECQRVVGSINNNIIKCRNIGELVIEGTPLENFKDIQGKLISKLHNLISAQVLIIQEHSSKLESSYEQLGLKYKNLIESCKDIDFSKVTPLIKGTPLQPSLKTLLAYANDSLTFAEEICALYETSLSALIVHGAKTTLPAINFKISRRLEQSASEIISYTYFCANNTI